MAKELGKRMTDVELQELREMIDEADHDGTKWMQIYKYKMKIEI